MIQQIFFIAPNGYPQVRATGLIGNTHGWCDTDNGDDPTKDQIIGVVYVGDKLEANTTVATLEKVGIMWLPNHRITEQNIKSEHAKALSKHGVTESDNTESAMVKVFAKSGFPQHKPFRF